MVVCTSGQGFFAQSDKFFARIDKVFCTEGQHCLHKGTTVLAKSDKVFCTKGNSILHQDCHDITDLSDLLMFSVAVLSIAGSAMADHSDEDRTVRGACGMLSTEKLKDFRDVVLHFQEDCFFFLIGRQRLPYVQVIGVSMI